MPFHALKASTMVIVAAVLTMAAILFFRQTEPNQVLDYETPSIKAAENPLASWLAKSNERGDWRLDTHTTTAFGYAAGNFVFTIANQSQSAHLVEVGLSFAPDNVYVTRVDSGGQPYTLRRSFITVNGRKLADTDSDPTVTGEASCGSNFSTFEVLLPAGETKLLEASITYPPGKVGKLCVISFDEAGRMEKLDYWYGKMRR